MAQLVVSAAGAAVGFMVGGPVGAQWGFALGSMVGGAMFGQKQAGADGPRLTDLRVSGTEYGQAIPWGIGAPRVAGQIWWASDRREITTTQEVGKGGGGQTSTSYSYEVDLLIGLNDGPIDGVTRIWINGKLVWTALASASDSSRVASDGTAIWSSLAIYTGSSTQLPDPTYEAAIGTGQAPAYRGRAYIVLQALQLGSSGQIPNITVEYSLSLLSSDAIVRRASIPSTTGTGLQFRNGSTGGVGSPVIVGASPNVRVAIVANGSTIVYQLDAVGTRLADSARTGAAEAYPGPRDSWSWAAGIIDGQPLRLQYRDQATGGTKKIIPLGTLTDTATEITTGADLSSVLPAGQYVHAVTTCSDGVHALIIAGTVPASGVSSSLWHIVKRTGGVATLERSGTIYTTVSESTFGLAGNHGDQLRAFHLEDDLTHVWTCLTSTITMWSIGDDDVLRIGSTLVSPDGPDDVTEYFPQPTVWAQAGMCYVVAGKSFSTFRRSGASIQTVSIRSAVEAVCTRAGLSGTQIDASALASITRPVHAFAMGQVGNARGTLEQLQTAYQFEMVLSDKLYFVPRGGAAVVTIPYADLGAGSGQARQQPLEITVGSDLELPPQVAVSYKNVSQDQQTATEYSDRLIAGQASLSTVQLGLALLPAEAKAIADAIVADQLASLVTTTLHLNRSYAYLQPSDVVQVADVSGTLHRLRLVRRQDSAGVLTFDAVADDAQAIVSSGTTDSGYAATGEVTAISSTVLYPLDIPLLRDADDAPGYYVAARGATATWPGAAVYSSANGTDYTSVATVAESAVLGTCTTTLGNWTGPAVMDEINSVTVNVAHGELSSVTRDALLLDASLNVMLIGSEVIQFATATLVSALPNVYKLTRLLRGRRGTEWASAGHVATERAVLLRTRGLRRVTQQATDLSQVRQLKGVSLGTTIAAVSPSAFTNTGISSAPLSPVDLRASSGGAGAIALAWTRRTRLASTFCGPAGISTPLGETSERYDVEIWNSTFTTRKRLFAGLTSAAVSYTYAQQVADWAAAQTTLYVRVYQLNGSGARGQALQAAVTATVEASSSLNPQLIAASASGWLAWSTRRESSGTPGTINDLLVLSMWKSSSPGGSYSIVREVTCSATAPQTWPAVTGALATAAAFGSYLLQIDYAVGASTAPKIIRTPLDLSSDPVVLAPSIVFTAPRMLVGDGSRVLLFGETNRVYSSTDGAAWTPLGSMSGAAFPYPIGGEPLVSHVITKIGTRFFMSFGTGGDIATTGPLFYTDNADARTGWTACTGISVNGVTQALHGQIVFDGTKHYAARVDYTAGTTTVFASSDGGATWASEYTTALATGFEVNTSGTTAAWIWQFHITGTTGSDKVRFYTYNGVTYEKTVGTTSWTAKASGLVNPAFGVVYGGAMAMTDNGAKYTLDGARVRYEASGVFSAATGF